MQTATPGRALFPILTFDARTLSPSFGHAFDPGWLDPQESIVSMLWKFAVMNALPGQMIAARLASEDVDPYDGVPVSRVMVDIAQLAKTLGVGYKLVHDAMLSDGLYKISSPHFRFCAKCLQRGYHGVVHQLETSHLCPIHGTWLQTACPTCGHVAPYVLNTRLLDAPFRCAACRCYYGKSKPAFLDRKPFTKQQRVSMLRELGSRYAQP